MRNSVKIVLVAALLQACETQVRKPDEPDATEAEVRVNRLLAEGRYELALAGYRQLAELYPDKSDLYRLRAAEALLALKRFDEADELSASVNPRNIDTRSLKTLLQADLRLRNNQPQQALALLSTAPSARVSASLRARQRHHRLRALAYERQSDFINAVRERLRYGEHTSRPAEREANVAKIWETMLRVETAALQQLHREDPRALSGWPELALMYRTLLADPDALERALASWKETYPAHPAHSTIVGRMLANSRRYHIRPRQIALLLPFRGDYGKASEAVRDGFIAAWYSSDNYKPLIKIHDANPANIGQAYLQAVEEGADFIVGPLEKQALKKLSESTRLPVTTLALNQVNVASDTTADNSGEVLSRLLQFGLSPEDEAREVAERAYADGHDQALVIVPADRWGRRLHDAFQEAWLALGGRIPERIDYNPQARDYSFPVRQLLNIDGSETRARQLGRKLSRKLDSEMRRRQDVDMIFMAAFPAAARQIVPQFRFYQAENIPVYSTSHIFTGRVNQQADMDINNVLFIDMPWVFSSRDGRSAVQSVIDEHFQVVESPYRRLYALGVDAFNLIPHLGRLAFEESAVFAGETGRLSLSGDGRIRRKPALGKIVNGKPELIGKP